MKIYNRPISVISLSDRKGKITPIKWQIEDENDGVRTYRILNVMKRSTSRIAGKNTCEFLCETEVRGMSKPCELRYVLDAAQWYLYKI